MRVLNNVEVAAVAGGYQAYSSDPTYCGDGYIAQTTFSRSVSTTTPTYSGTVGATGPVPSGSATATTGSQTVTQTVSTACAPEIKSDSGTSGGSGNTYNITNNYYGGSGSSSGSYSPVGSPDIGDEDKVANVMF